MKIETAKMGDHLVVRYRVYYRKESTFTSYMAQIIGPDPNYIIRRLFLTRYDGPRRRFVQYRFMISRDGIYELSVRRRADGKIISRERYWLIVYKGQFHWYEDGDMNYQYVLYCESLIRSLTQDA